MIQRFRTLWFKIFPITREKAIKIAASQPTTDISMFSAQDTPGNANIYMARGIDEPCWYVSAPWGNGMDGAMLRSRRIVVIARKTGRVLYDGSANDEG